MSLTLHSERLTLTPYDLEDIDIAIEIFTDPDVCRYAGRVSNVEEIRANMHTRIRRGGNGCIGVWRVSASATGEKLGTVALLPMPIEHDETDWDLVVPGEMPDADIEIGFFIKKAAWGNGYATEACRRLLRFAFEHSPLHEVVATFDDDNQGSRNVLTKSGFIDRGRRRSYGAEGTYFRITREEWLRPQDSPPP
jgi:RimJ/RimL family protein N-acetyltransferase